jgi:hypothetical protein
MKKVLISLLICFLIVFDDNIHHCQKFFINAGGMYRVAYDASSISKLEEISDEVVRVRMLWNVKTVLHYEMNDEIPSFGYTITKVKVIEVYKSTELVENQIINFVEPIYTYTVPASNMKFLICDGNYKPLKRYRDYILFICKYDGTRKRADPQRHGCYEALAEYGKYLVNYKFYKSEDTSSFNLSDFDIWRQNPQYEKLFVEVMKKYK